ncbi:alanine racemase [Salinisphaera sp. Q1T1-3]|uniref:alanine racemase n=1 Tax=Salinisphaera sp. Q1T1-3 TaxID=2321229 RepID=UPI000E73D920|nr:alanine racemase [Salinisphaera sp. Q1T1-3]RJS93816.1 alanine racemase [Salinisphaera sp. Q1T1-3]
MTRAVATIDRAALGHNLARVRAMAPGREIFAAVKADGYGHGAAVVAATLAEAGVDGFAVSSLDEALALRWAGIAAPIMTLSQPLDGPTLAAMGEHAISPVVFDAAHWAALADYRGPRLAAWCKLDSGMHRLGFPANEAGALATRFADLAAVDLVGWMTHLGCADDPTSPLTLHQLACFDNATAGLPGKRSIANSAGVIAWPDSHADRLRPGIMLYGSSPMTDRDAEALDLSPVMHLTAPLISRRDLPAGEPIGYGATWSTPEAMPVGVVGIGYGDGYPRHAPSGTPIRLGDAIVPLIGRVSMDMITVDLRTAPGAAIGDRATLWGRGLSADTVARAAGTIAYELFCQLTPRVQFDII